MEISQEFWAAPYERPPFEYTRKLREEMVRVIEATSPADFRNFVEHQLPQYLLPIAHSEMVLEDVHKTHVLIGALDSVHRERLIQKLDPVTAEKARRRA